MEHAKKLVLLSRESVERLQNNSSKLSSSQTSGTVISRLDAEMNHFEFERKRRTGKVETLSSRVATIFLFQRC